MVAHPDQQSDSKAWELFVELRKEIIESQKIRAQLIGFKITFISSAVALIFSVKGIPPKLLIIPAFAAIFFDFLIQGYSFSIKRIGRYCRESLEPIIFREAPFLSWEEFMSSRENRESYSMAGNLGLTVLAAVPAVIALAFPFSWSISVPLFFVLVLLLAVDSLSFLTVGRYGRKRLGARAESKRGMAANLPS